MGRPKGSTALKPEQLFALLKEVAHELKKHDVRVTYENLALCTGRSPNAVKTFLTERPEYREEIPIYGGYSPGSPRRPKKPQKDNLLDALRAAHSSR